MKATPRLLLVPLLGALAAGGGFVAAHSAHADAPPITPPAVTAPSDVSGLVASVQPAVVNITVEHSVKGISFDSFEGLIPIPREREGKQIGAGSGFIIDDQGHVVTNAHVVDGAEKVRVKLSDDRELSGKVLGKDERLDVAVLKLEGASNLPHVNLGSSASLKVGEPVVAIGNPFGLGGTVTSGIVSAKSRQIGAGPYDDFIQTDASINPGNSGGPLFDAKGQVVGMNTAINPSGQGIGFAIPSDAIKAVLPQLITKGHVERGRIGAHIQEIDSALAKALALGGTSGALVGDVEKDGPAAKAGLQSGDVITAVDGVTVPHGRDLPRMIASHAPGSKVTLDVHRHGASTKIPVTLGTLEDQQPAKTSSLDAAPPQGRLGIELRDGKNGGAVVQRVSPLGAAAGALAEGDVIVEVNHQKVTNASEAAAKVKAAPADKPILLKIEHGGASRWVAIDH